MNDLIKEALAKAVTGFVFTLTIISLTVMIFFSLVVIYATLYAYLNVYADTIQKTHQSIDHTKK
jgi:hypothetical protein